MSKTNTYYFDGHTSISDPDSVWSNETNAFDGSLSTFATSSGSNGSTSVRFLSGVGTTSPSVGTDISQVRARTHSGFDGGNAGWSDYVVLSVPTGGWTWGKVRELEVRAYRTAPFDDQANGAILYQSELLGTTTKEEGLSFSIDIYRVEIEVTSELTDTTTHTVDSFINILGTPSHTIDSVCVFQDEISVVIGGVQQKQNILTNSFNIKDHINQQVDQAFFDIRNVKPQLNQEVVCTFKGAKIFAGVIVKVETKTRGLYVTYKVTCKDYSQFLDRQLVNKVYTNETVSDIINDIITLHAPDFTTNNVVVDKNIRLISFNRVPVSQALQDLAELLNYSWYVDYDKDIHFFAKNEELAPFNLSANARNHNWDSLRIVEDFSQIRNQITVIGGEFEAEERNESYVADGTQLQFPLAYKFARVPTVTVDSSAVTVGVDGFDNEDNFDAFWSFEGKYIRFKDSTKPSTGDVVSTTGTPLLPVIVRVPDVASIAKYGVYEFRLKDEKIISREDAIERAIVELQSYADKVNEASFSTYEFGLRSGQVININVGGINEDFIIQSVSMRMRNIDEAIWQVELATVRTLGIIAFLQRLMRDDTISVEGDILLDLQQFAESNEFTDTLTLPSRTGSAPYKWADATDPDDEGKWNFFTWS